MIHPSARDDRERADRGYALLVALLAIIGLTVLATGGFLLSRTESQMSRNYRGAVGGFYLAQSGLSTYMGTVEGEPPDDTLSYSFAGGSADVWATELVDSGDGHRIWRVTSRGTPSPPYDGLTRQVSTLVLLDPLFTDAPGGFISADTLLKSGSAGVMSGDDETTEADCPEGGQASRPGIWAYFFDPGGDYTAADGSPDTIRTKRDPSVLEGSDPSNVLVNPYDSIATATGWSLDWQGVLDGTATHHDYVVSDVSNFPDLASDPSEWAVVMVDQPGGPTSTPQNEVTLDDTCCTGQGVLIIEQSVKFSGDFSWDGIILAGGSVRSSGTTDLQGSIANGLNTTLAGFSLLDLDKTSIGSGTKNFQYNSCTLGKAGRNAGKLKEIPGSWFESYSF